jgi:hypothetical protein
VRLSPWRDLGHDGDLSVTFLNRRLFQSVFTPADLKAYTRALARTGLVVKDGGPEKRIDLRTVVRSAEPGGRDGYVAWSDEAIQAEQQAWLSRCS